MFHAGFVNIAHSYTNMFCLNFITAAYCYTTCLRKKYGVEDYQFFKNGNTQQ